ncbi:MAG: EAL and GGDEF domain-containing protein [Pseudomonadota bacterium]
MTGTADPEGSGAAAGFVLDIDRDDRIRGCRGRGVVALCASRAQLLEARLEDLLPDRVRGPVLEAVTSARSAPETDCVLPMLRLRRLDDATLTAPFQLSLTADCRGGLQVTGAETAPVAPQAPPLDQGDDRFYRMFHSSPDAILVFRYRDGTIIDFNARFTELLGYTRERAIGHPAGELELWADQAQRDAILQDFHRHRQVTDREARMRTASDATVPVELSMRFIELDGELCVLCIGRDITRRLEAESAARSSEEKFTQVFNQSPDGIVILRNSDLVIRDANPAFVAASGYTAEELIGSPATVFDQLTDPAAQKAALKAVRRDGRIANQAMVFRNRAGVEIPSLLSVATAKMDGEECLICIVKDVSELRTAQEQLRRSEERFRGAFENAPIGILLLDNRGQIFRANRFATDLLCYPDRALNGTHISRLVPEGGRADLETHLTALVSGRETTFRSERRMCRADGREIWTNCHVVAQRGHDGEPLYCIMQVADITEMKTSQQRMERLAFYDTLTELANRRLFNDRLAQAVERCRRHGEQAALLYLDLDQFKRVNDTLGHESGDALLKEVAHRLAACVRREDTVGRPGGDEFTILLYDIADPERAGQVAQKILRALERPVTVLGHKLVVTTSIGITVVPDDGTEPTALLKNADLAMYRAKDKGRNNYQFFSEELNTNAVRRLRMEYELRRAVERNELELHFQPMVALADQSIIGVESLLRWRHPERGMVPPDEFIGIAEETGAIVGIGNWVIREACIAARRLAEHRGAPLSIAVNISPRQFRAPDLVDTVRSALCEAHLEPGYLELEITETMLMQDVEAAAEIVWSLHELGVRLAIDDFGTGYSSLNYLKKFPISTIKVDRSFVADIPDSSDDAEITAAVIAMAHRLRIQVVAEGVETRAQLDFLTEQRCDYAQGFWFGRALPLADMTGMLENHRERGAPRATGTRD